MKYVVDSNVALKWVLPEIDSAKALLLRTDAQAGIHEPLLRRAVSLSSSARVGVYDCLYVALADREQCQLVTADDKLIKTLQPTCPFIISLSSLP